MPKTNVMQCSKRRSKNYYPSGFVSTLEERIPVKNGELQDGLQHGASQLHHDREKSPLHLTNVFKLRNATEACVVVEPLNISTLKSIQSLCGKRKFISDQKTTPVVDESSTAISPYSQILQAKKSRTDEMPSQKGEAPKSSNHFEQESKPSWYTKNMHLDKILSSGELEGLLSTAELPQTIIVLMGGIGTGKSTLVNALLDRNCLLPISDDRACTSVVVEVVQNTNTDKMEAVVQFLGKSVWFKEIEMLLDDLKCRDGLRMIKPPDPSSDIYASYCKVMAVYGKIDTFECLSNNNSVNKWLGQTHHIMCDVNEGDTFQDQIEQFITGNKHGPNTPSLWPIIKHVLIKVPNADVCSSGASLVDLPGIGDANPARDEITTKFLKECHSVWIINAMTRASDDVTSRNLLDQGVRRQIIMDGKMESLAIVCTMSDRFCEHNTIRDHALDNLCKDLKVQKCSMELEKRHLEQKIRSYMDSEDILKAKARIWEIHEDIMKRNYAISKICARPRNEMCIRHIQQLYRNIKMQSILIPDHHDGDDSDMEVHLKDWKFDKSDEDGVKSNIRAFCCSSTEYQKLSGCIPAYGPPLVFNEAEETQVPALKEYVHELTYARRVKGLERFIRRLGRCVFTFQSNVRTVIDMDTNAGRGIEAAICDELSHFQEQIQTLINSLGESLEKLFRGNIRHLLQKRATNAKMDACIICNKWGPPVYRL